MQNERSAPNIKEDDDYFEEFIEEGRIYLFILDWKHNNLQSININDWESNWEKGDIDINLENKIKLTIQKYKAN